MAETTATYRTRVGGLWSTRHRIEAVVAGGPATAGAPADPSSASGAASSIAAPNAAAAPTELGVLSIERSAKGLIVGGVWRPAKGEVLHVRRDPGLLRSQFSLWTEGHEWLGSSLRWSFVRREISVATGNKPYRMVPVPGFRRGWRMLAPKTGEVARVVPLPFRRGARIEVFRRIDFEIVVFAYFLGTQVFLESLWPGPIEESDRERLTTPSKA